MKHCCWRFGEQGKDTDEGTSILLFIRIIRKLHSRRSFHLRKEEQPGNYGTILKAWHLVAGTRGSSCVANIFITHLTETCRAKELNISPWNFFFSDSFVIGSHLINYARISLSLNVKIKTSKNGFQKFGKPYSLHKPTQQCKRLTDAPAPSANVHGLSLFLPHR